MVTAKLEDRIFRNMKYFIGVLGLYFLLFTLSYASSVTASVNTQNVVKGNPIELSIRAIGKSVVFPKVRQIEGIGVTDSGTSTSTRMHITAKGMEKESVTTRRYIFVPTHDIVIPPYEVRVGDQTLKTKAITIKVLPSNAPTMHTNSAYAFRMKSSKNKVVVGESFVITLYLSMAQSLEAQQVSEYVEPSSVAFFFKDLGEQKQYRQGDTNILKKQYSVTAKKEGNFTISSASVKLGVTDKSRQDLFGRYGIRWIDVRSNTLDIEVNAPQTDTDLVGEFTLVSQIDKQKVKVNKPVNLTIRIQGKGNLEDFEFPNYEIDGVTIYADDAKITNHIENDKLVSVYSKNFAFIAEEDFEIPKRTISSYNPNTHEVEILEIPHYSVNIEKKKGFVSHLPTITKPLASTDAKKETTEKISENDKKLIPVWMLVLSFVVGMLVMYFLRFMPQLWMGKEKPYKEREALKILYAHISEDKKIEEMVHKLYARKGGDKSVKIDKKELKEMVKRFS